jgi:uncharacterized membrane protein YGL010W
MIRILSSQVPCILFSLFLFQAHLTLIRTTRYIYISWASLTALFYVVFYLRVDTVGALLFLPFLYGMYATAHLLVAFDQDDYRLGRQERLYKKHDHQSADDADADTNGGITTPTTSSSSSVRIPWTGTGRMLYYALGLHLLAWYAQIHPGHAVLEGAKPALVTSLGDALTTAPLFAFYEGVWWVGLRRDYQAQVLERVAVQTRELCRSGAKMRICESLEDLRKG